MLSLYRRQKGFTLIELISIIIILGILSAVAIPRYYDYKSTAELTVVKATLGNVRTAINNFYLNEVSTNGEGRYPTATELNTPGVVMQEAIPDNPWHCCSMVETAPFSVNKLIPRSSLSLPK